MRRSVGACTDPIRRFSSLVFKRIGQVCVVVDNMPYIYSQAEKIKDLLSTTTYNPLEYKRGRYRYLYMVG